MNKKGKSEKIKITQLKVLKTKFREYLRRSHARLQSKIAKGFSLTFPEAAKRTIEITEKFLMEDKKVGIYIKNLRDKIGFVAASPRTCIEYAARQTCQGKSLPKDDPKILASFYELIVQPCMQFKSDALKSLVFGHPELDKSERQILSIGFYIAQEFDKIFEKWWKQVVVPYRTSPLSDKELKELIRKSRKNNPYSVLVSPNYTPITTSLTPKLIKSAREIPLAKAFPEEISKARAYLLYLVDQLSPREKEYQEYFRALYKALGNEDLKNMEKLWLRVDKTWVKISHKKRALPVHMMEDGYHDPFRISPEFRVMFRSTEFADVIAIMRRSMKKFASLIEDKIGLVKIDNIDIGTFFTVVNGGCSIDFRFAGQSVPNRPKAQKLGMKIFLDGASMEIRLEHHKRLLEFCLDKETSSWAVPALKLDIMYALVAGHEFAHPLLVTDKLIKSFGEHKPEVEEGKATLFGVAGIQKAIESGHWGPSTHLGLSACLLSEGIRGMDKNSFDNPTFSPYANEAMMILSVLRRHNLITIARGKLHMDKKSAASGKIAGILFDKLTSPLISAYKAASLPRALKIVKNFANRNSREIKSTYEIVNANLKN